MVKLRKMKIIRNILSVLLFFPMIAQSAEQSSDVESLDALRAFIEVYEHIKRDYVEEIDDQTLLNYAINGMLTKLDPHSGYLKPQDVASLRDSTAGSFGGIGIEMDVVDGLIEVIAPIDDSPASRAGILAKDIITHVDDEPVRDISLQEAIKILRGPLGSAVTLGILREVQSEPQKITISLERAIIRVTSVKHEMLPHGIGYLRISQFQNRTGPDLIKAIGKLQFGGKLTGLILDLRNNPALTAKMINAMIAEEGGNEASEYFASAVNSGISMANGTLDPNFDPEDIPPTDDAEQEDNQGEDPVEEAEAVEEESSRQKKRRK